MKRLSPVQRGFLMNLRRARAQAQRELNEIGSRIFFWFQRPSPFRARPECEMTRRYNYLSRSISCLYLNSGESK
jgi:hypothetical protein